MFFELIGTFAIGFVGAGVALIINYILGRRLPRWFIPVSAGVAMLGFTIFNEYSWFERTAAVLPEGIKIAKKVEDKAIYRPWTYVWPYVDRFIAVDAISIRRHQNFPNQRILDLLVYGRWAPVNRVRAVFDCAQGRRADLVDGVRFTNDGKLEGATWHKTGLDDPVTQLACEVG